MINAKCAVPESVSVFFFLGGLSSEALHLLLLNFWMPVPSLGSMVVLEEFFFFFIAIYDVWTSVNKLLNLGFLMMLPHEAALITSGITKILEIYIEYILEILEIYIEYIYIE